MKHTKTRPIKRDPIVEMRLVEMEAPHGTFLRFGWLGFGELGEVTGFEPLPIVFNGPEEAANVAQQLVAASQQPIVAIGRLFQRVH